MSGPEESDNSRKGDKGRPPTASFDGLMEPGSQIGQFRIERELGCNAVVAYWNCGSLRTF